MGLEIIIGDFLSPWAFLGGYVVAYIVLSPSGWIFGSRDNEILALLLLFSFACRELPYPLYSA